MAGVIAGLMVGSIIAVPVVFFVWLAIRGSSTSAKCSRCNDVISDNWNEVLPEEWVCDFCRAKAAV